MKRITIFLLLALLCCTGLQAQNSDCNGLKNPTNFTLYQSNISGKYSAQVGTKIGSVSTCSSLGMTFTGTVLTGTAITSATGGSSCESNLGTDYQNEFAIKGSGTDALTANHLSYLPNNTFTHSVRIGNACGGTEANALYYDFQVSNSNALVYIYFSISLYNALHDAANNPEFAIKIKKYNASTSTYETLSDTMCYIVQSPTSSTNLGVFTAGGSNNIYRPWEKVVINLYKYLYQKVRIEVTTGDCAYTAHYGYGYIAGQCAPMSLTATGCASGSSDTVSNVKAPSGLLTYQWYACRDGITNETDTSYYTRMPGCRDSILYLRSGDFIPTTGPNAGDTLSQRDFLCRMMSKMNPTYPIYSSLRARVGNMKPTLIVDSALFCNGLVHLKDISTVIFTNNNDSNKVDTSFTLWKVYNGVDTLPANLLYTTTAPSIDYDFTTGGAHTVLVRTHSYRHECWNEKTIHVRSLVPPNPKVTFDQTMYCIGDTVNITDMTPNPLNSAQYSTYRKWIVHKAGGVVDTVVGTGTLPGGRRLSFVFDTTSTRVEMWTRTDQVTYRDTNLDGVVDPVYCFSYLDTIVPGEKYPELTVMGDTIVCYGNDSQVSVRNANGEACSFAWYRQLNGSNPLGTNANFSENDVTTNKKYYVKVTTNGAQCITWDSITIMLVEPTLTVPDKEMCTDEHVHLYAGGASTYTWSSMPDDPSLSGQQANDTISVSPTKTTTYTLVGHGSNGCSADPLTETIKVYPYPIPTFTLNPGFIDSEKPTVTFSDVSPNSTTSLWNFGNGVTSTKRSVSQTFSDISQDSVLISLTSGNALGCKSDTTFYVPIDLFSVWFPNVFTPTMNSNTTFHIYTHNPLQFYSLFIYDRRGQLVFHSTDQNEAWNGKFKGKLCEQGSYVYVCNYRRDGTFEITTLKGTVMLLQ